MADFFGYLAFPAVIPLFGEIRFCEANSGDVGVAIICDGEGGRELVSPPRVDWGGELTALRTRRYIAKPARHNTSLNTFIGYF